MGAPDIDKVWELWQSGTMKVEQATGYVIQIVLDQERHMIRQGRSMIQQQDELVKFRKELAAFRRELQQIRRLIDQAA